MAYSETKPAANAEPDRGGANRPADAKGKVEGKVMGRILRLLLVLAVLGVLALIGYSYSGYLQPETRTVTQPVQLDAD